MLYLILISFGIILSLSLGLGISTAIFGIEWWYVVLTVLLTFIALFAINAVVALFVRYVMPKKYFNANLKIHKVHKWEIRFFKKIQINKWKDLVPEAGRVLVGFDKTKVANKEDETYINKFLSETIYAETMHFWSIIFAGFVFFISPQLLLTVVLPQFVINFVINLLPVMIQRYNRPRLMVALERINRLKAKKLEKDIETH